MQQRLGVRGKIETFARKVVRDHLPDQHREFYGKLPFVVLGTVDAEGRPWASILAGRPGFMSSETDRMLSLSARPLYGDPLNDTLKPGADVGILGIEPATRRRNRLTGRIAAVAADGFSLSVTQTFGNCPQYIQTRSIEILPEIDAVQNERPVSRSSVMDQNTRQLIARSDTLFVATSYSDGSLAPWNGADVSHRGGKPGFVRVEDDRTFVFPDFSGNNHFNSVGNIVLNPRTGFLFIDFETRDLVYLTGRAEIVWDGPEVQAFAGAERLIRFRADEVVRIADSLPLDFAFGEYSPMLERTGSWQQTAEIIAAEAERNTYLTYEVFDVQRESDEISSFYLRRADGKSLPRHKPGQFLPIRLNIAGHDGPVTRTYTVSDAPNGDHYRLSVKREGGDALVSNFLHRAVEPGYRLEAMAPRGKFVLDQSSERPVVLISAGVGITPMIAMTNHIINEGLRTRNFRRVYFIHGARNGAVHGFGDHVRALADRHDNFTAHIRFSEPGESDRLGESHDSEGLVDVDLIRQVLPFDDHDFYLCGPPGFMQAIYDGLLELGVREERIHYEAFGPATVLKHDARSQDSARAKAGEPVPVRFAGSDIDAEWTPDTGTLLELAEAAGLQPTFSCRSGICGSCATRLKCGKVDYLEEPTAPLADDEVLICCSVPRSGSGDGCGEDQGVVLDL